MSADLGVMLALGAGVLAAPFVLPLRLRFTLAVALSVLQGFALSVGDVRLSVAFVCAMTLWPETIRYFRKVFISRTLIPLPILLVLQLVSLAWSSDLRLGIRTVVFSAPFIMLTVSSYALAQRSPKQVYRGLVWLVVLMLAQNIAVILFRLSPDLEYRFHTSMLARITINPNSLEALLSNLSRNNVLDPAKAGGLFLNANVAAAYMGMGSVVAWTLGRILNSRLFAVVGFLAWSSVMFTGSKLGIMLALAVPLLWWSFSVSQQCGRRIQFRALASLVAVVVVSASAVVIRVDPGILQGRLAEAIAASVRERMQIWRYAVEAFISSPIMGQGFGGWHMGYRSYAEATGLNITYPPHNTLIFLWSQSGLVAVLLGVDFMVRIMRLGRRVVETAQDEELRTLGRCLLLVAGWLFLQGMAENWGLTGEERQQAILAVTLGLTYGLWRRWRQEGT